MKGPDMEAKIGKEYKNARFEVGKEQVNRWQVMVIYKGKIERAVNAYCWMGRSSSASVVYAAIWVYGPKKSTSGRGSAGGGGYDKEEAAMQGAISSAGITLLGDPPITEALTAIARAAGYRGQLVIV